MKTIKDIFEERNLSPTICKGENYMYKGDKCKVSEIEDSFVTIEKENGDTLTINKSELGDKINESVCFEPTNEECEDDTKKKNETKDSKDKEKKKDDDSEESKDSDYSGKNNDAYNDSKEDKKDKELNESFDKAIYDTSNIEKRSQIIEHTLNYRFKRIKLKSIENIKGIYIQTRNNAVKLKEAKVFLFSIGIDSQLDVDNEGMFSLIVDLE